MKDRIAEAGFVNDQHPQADAFRFDGGCQTGRPRSNANNVVSFHGNFSLPGVLRNCKLRTLYCFGGVSRSSASSCRNDSSSSSFSGVAFTSFFFQPNTSPHPPFTFPLTFPPTTYNPPPRL